jgi:hypothetical protein
MCEKEWLFLTLRNDEVRMGGVPHSFDVQVRSVAAPYEVST